MAIYIIIITSIINIIRMAHTVNCTAVTSTMQSEFL